MACSSPVLLSYGPLDIINPSDLSDRLARAQAALERLGRFL